MDKTTSIFKWFMAKSDKKKLFSLNGSDTVFSFQKTQLQNIAKCISRILEKRY